MDPRHFQVLVPFFSIAIVTNMKIVWQNMNCVIASNKALHIRNDIRITLQTFLVFKCARLCAPNYANHLFLGFLAQTYVSSALTWCAHVPWPRQHKHKRFLATFYSWCTGSLVSKHVFCSEDTCVLNLDACLPIKMHLFFFFHKQQNNSLPEQLPVVDLHIYILLFPKIEESTFIPSAIKLIRIRRG